MERWNNLDWYQKGILLILAALFILFSVLYGVSSSRVGYRYMDTIFLSGEENGNTVYTATVEGQPCRFVVTPDETVTFQCGSKVYGPYTAIEDPTAIPQDHSMRDGMTGLEVREGNDVIFRGGAIEMDVDGFRLLLIGEDGGLGSFTVTVYTSSGVMMDADGNIVDPMEPSVTTVLELMHGPELESKALWAAWFAGAFVSVMTAISILFADELFRWKLQFRVRDVDRIEPSDLELAGRYIGWTLLTVGALIMYIGGLQ